MNHMIMRIIDNKNNIECKIMVFYWSLMKNRCSGSSFTNRAIFVTLNCLPSFKPPCSILLVIKTYCHHIGQSLLKVFKT